MADIRDSGQFRLRSHLDNFRQEAWTLQKSLAVRSTWQQKNRFIIYTRSRSGGTFLLNLLSSHLEICCEKYGWGAELLARRWFFPERYVETRAALASHGFYGFKLKPEELRFIQRVTPHDFLKILQQRGWKIVYLRRRNFLRQAISLEIGIRTQIWHVSKNHECVTTKKREKVVIDFTTLLRHLEAAERMDALEDDDLRDLPHLSLVYETDLLLAEQQNAIANRVYQFLDLPAHTAQTQMARVGSDDLAESVANWDELRSALLQTRFNVFLND